MSDPSTSRQDHKALKAAADEFYREQLVEWMAAHDISTGVSALAFADLLTVIGDYIDGLKKQIQLISDHE